jgi:hypothetical protein
VVFLALVLTPGTAQQGALVDIRPKINHIRPELFLEFNLVKL